MKQMWSSIRRILASCLNVLRESSDGIPSTSVSPSSPGSRIDWERLFDDARFVEQAPQRIAEANKRIRHGIGDLHQTVEDFERREQRWVLRLIEVVDFCEGLKGSADIEAVQLKLRQVVESSGVQAWSPLLGEPPPPGCETKALSSEAAARPEACLVIALIRTGYRCADNCVLRRPLVLVDVPSTARESTSGVESTPESKCEPKPFRLSPEGKPTDNASKATSEIPKKQATLTETSVAEQPIAGAVPPDLNSKNR